MTAFKAWQTVRNHWGDGWSHCKDARVELERAADAVIEASELPRALDLDVLAAAERMLTAYGTLLPAVADRHGPRTALAVKMRSLAWAITNGRDKQRWWWLLSEPTNIAPPAVDSGWNALRVALSAADSATYAEARDDAARRRADQPDPVARVPLDFVFPGEEPWSRDDAKAIPRAADLREGEHGGRAALRLPRRRGALPAVPRSVRVATMHVHAPVRLRPRRGDAARGCDARPP